MIVIDTVADPSALSRELPQGELLFVCEGTALTKERLLALRRSQVRVRVPVPGFDDETHARYFGRGTPREALRGVALAVRAGLEVEVAIPIEPLLGPAAARMHGLARALPGIRRYLLTGDDEREIDDARAAARELGVELVVEAGARIDTELQALLAGIKPVIRLSTESSDEETFIARYRNLGLHAVSAEGVFLGKEGLNSHRMRLVYVGRTLADVERVRDLEAKTFRPVNVHRERADEFGALGRALGYPPCCAEAFVDRVVIGPNGRMRKSYPAEYYLSALGAWDPEPRWELNHLLFDTGDAVVSFTACSYRCPVALDYAAKVLARVGTYANRLKNRLGVDVVVDARGARVRVEREGSVIVKAVPRMTRSGEIFDPIDQELAQRVLNARVGPRGMLELTEPDPPVLVPFSVTSRA
ncbi:MAG: radical SAM protein [Polyangiales bacterium]